MCFVLQSSMSGLDGDSDNSRDASSLSIKREGSLDQAGFSSSEHAYSTGELREAAQRCSSGLV